MAGELETHLVSVERVKEYSATPTEVSTAPGQRGGWDEVGVGWGWGELETQLVSVERVKEYSATPTREAPRQDRGRGGVDSQLRHEVEMQSYLKKCKVSCG